MVWGSREGPSSSSPSLDGFLCNGISVSSQIIWFCYSPFLSSFACWVWGSRETASIVRNTPTLGVDFRMKWGLIIAIPHSANKSKISPRAVHIYERRLKSRAKVCYKWAFLEKAIHSVLNQCTVVIQVDAMTWKAYSKWKGWAWGNMPLIPALRRASTDRSLCKFQGSLVYLVSSRPARATWSVRLCELWQWKTTKQARKEVIELAVINGSVDEREFCYLSKTVSC